MDRIPCRNETCREFFMDWAGHAAGFSIGQVEVKIKDIQTEEDSHGRADREEAVLQLSLSGRRDGKGSGASVYCNRQQRFLEEPGTQCVV